MNWATLTELAGDGLSAVGVRELARRHDLDLPHVPVLSHDSGHRWTVRCLGCQLDTGWTGPACQNGAWAAPPLLLDAGGISAGLVAAARVLNRRPETEEETGGA